MQIKSSQYKIRGMNKDLSYSAFNPEYSWDNKNIRLTARDNNDLLSITNEIGNAKLLLNRQLMSSYVSTFSGYVNELRIIKYKYTSTFIDYVDEVRATQYSYTSNFNGYINELILV